jgi:hypothetical protein
MDPSHRHAAKVSCISFSYWKDNSHLKTPLTAYGIRPVQGVEPTPPDVNSSAWEKKRRVSSVTCMAALQVHSPSSVGLVCDMATW